MTSDSTDSRPFRRGFTLVELLVVIVIITLLVAIALPVMAHVRESARHVTCMSNQRQLGAAVFTHFNETGSYAFPSYYKMDGIFPSSALVCPSDPMPDTVPEGLFGNEEQLALSYALNLEYGLMGLDWEDIENPSGKAYLFDGVTALIDSDQLAMRNGGGRAMPVVLANAGPGGFGGTLTLGTATNDQNNRWLDTIDTLALSLTENPGGQKRVKWTHCPPGNPENAQQQLLPFEGVAGHMRGHGSTAGNGQACCGVGYWGDGINSITERMQAAFMRRHLTSPVGNVLMLDGHVEPAQELTRDMLLNLDGGGSGNGGGPGGGGPGGGGPGGGGPGGGGPGGGGPGGGGPGN